MNLVKKLVGLYRDDGLVLIKGKSGRIADKLREKLHTLFEQFNLKITAQVNHQSVNFLDVTFNLTEERFQPYRKPNNQALVKPFFNLSTNISLNQAVYIIRVVRPANRNAKDTET